MPKKSLNDTVGIKLGRRTKAWKSLDAKWKREYTSNTEIFSGIGINDTKIDVNIQDAENNINSITKRTRIFTTAFLIIMTLVLLAYF